MGEGGRRVAGGGLEVANVRKKEILRISDTFLSFLFPSQTLFRPWNVRFGSTLNVAHAHTLTHKHKRSHPLRRSLCVCFFSGTRECSPCTIRTKVGKVTANNVNTT